MVYPSVESRPISQDFYDVRMLRNHDGDTMVFNLPNLPPLFSTMPVRLYGIDTPEIISKDPCEVSEGIKARNFVHDELIKAKSINLTGCTKDKYFRLLCSVKYDTKDLTTELLNKNMGYAYYGDKKKKLNYCKP